MAGRRSQLFLLLVVAAAARLVMHMAALPPYAGLDEVYHVARLAFVLQEHRNPTVAEKSVPPYIEASMNGDPRAMPAFCLAGERWPEVVRSRPVIVDRSLTAGDLGPYTRTNYEAQQPAMYYSLIAPVARLLPHRTPLYELRLWRFVSVLFALIVVIATAFIGGNRGMLAAAVVVALPTWLTLVVRASNDAMACALVAVALAITLSAPTGLAIIAEALAWAGALALKLYTWPLAIVVPLLWRRQRAARDRIAVVSVLSALALVATMADLYTRTNNALGHFGFDRPERIASTAPGLRIVDMIKITIASGIWTSGQHNDAMRPLAMAMYVLPILGIAVWSARRPRRASTGETPVAPLIIVPLATFALAQIIDAAAFARQARAAGIDLPLGGKEGWYWYVLVPIVVGILFGSAFQRSRVVMYGVTAWLLAWDVVIHEVALFHDFAGTASPAHPSALFRWGPLQPPFTADLSAIGVGPMAGHLLALRLIEIAALVGLFALESISHSHDRPDHLAVPGR